MNRFPSWWKKKVMPGALAITLTFSFGLVVNAEEVPKETSKQEQEATVVKFTDVENHWAQEAIERMAEYGIINGYEDSTFRPDLPVTQLQAVSIVTNVFKLKSDDIVTEGNESIGEGVPEYAKDIVKVAVLNDLIESDDIRPFYDQATRMFVANLLANTFDLDKTEIDINTLTFSDITKLSTNEKINLAIAVQNGIVSGHEDNTFKPFNSVTRAQMATFASRLYDKLAAENDDVEKYENIEGIISSISSDKKELTIGLTTYGIVENVKVTVNKETSQLADLEKEMKVSAVVLNGKIVEINATKVIEEKPEVNVDDSDRIVTGTITDVFTDTRKLKIDSKTFDVLSNVFIEINGDLADFKYLEKEMQVVIVLSKDQIKSIYAFVVEDLSPIEFKILENADGDNLKEAKITGDRITDVTPDLDDGDLTIRLNGGTKKTINVKEIDGDQKDGKEVAKELEEAIEDAVGTDRVKVTFEEARSRFIFETDNSPKNVVPSIQFDGDDDVLDALGLDDDLVKGAKGEEAMKISVESDATRDDTYELNIKVKEENIAVSVRFSVEKGDTADEVAEEIADALEDNSYIRSIFEIDVDDQEVILTPKDEDLEVEIEIGTDVI